MEELDSRPVSVILYCRKYDLQNDVFQKLLDFDYMGMKIQYNWLNTEKSLVCGTKYYQGQIRRIEEELKVTVRYVCPNRDSMQISEC